jgi:phage terminase large subunit
MKPPQLNLTLSQKQHSAFELLDDPQVVELEYGGAAGGGKTLLICLWAVLEMSKYPGIRIGLGRKELTRLKQTTVMTLIREAHPLLGIKPDMFRYSDMKGLIQYENGSSIQLIDLARQPSDPDFDSLGSLNLTHVIIEEAGEIIKKAKDVFSARKNRFMNRELDLVGKTVLTGNPSMNFTRQEYYEPYNALGAGDMQKWQIGEVEVAGVMKPAYRAFIKALATDNPFLPQNYIEELKRLPLQERKRLYEGNWDYADDDSMLFKDLLIDRSLASEVPEGTIYLGVDVADKGKDKTVVSVVRGNVLTEQIEINVDTTGEKAISESISLELIKIAQQRGMSHIDARRIAVDTVGVGVGVRDFMRTKGWFIVEFIAGAKASQDGYKNLRSESLWDLSQDMDKGEFKIYSQLPTLGDYGEGETGLRRQLKAHEYESEDRIIKVKPKAKIKEDLGISPDLSDSANIARWISKGGIGSPRNDQARVRF